MFGPLPRLHRLLVVAAVIVVGVVSGVWVAQFSSVPAAAVAGAAWGGAAGLLLGYLLLHDFQHRPRAVRVRRR